MPETANGPAATSRSPPPSTPRSSYFYENMEQLDRVFGREEPGFSYSRYDNPSNQALEELCASLESGHGALACSSGMAAIHVALLTALTDRPKSIVAANALVRSDVKPADDGARAAGRGRAFRGYL